MKWYAALEARGAPLDLLLAAADDFAPTAVEERGDSLLIFFSTPAARDAARAALTPLYEISAIDVPDEDWARRSQQNLKPITVGRITVAPPWASRGEHSPVYIVILPSMGFGTGHHATTRLCLAALQRLDLREASVLDAGTGSGVLAIAASMLGAKRSIGIDNDADAIQSAQENLALNPDAGNVTFEVADLAAQDLPRADVITANLTAALLIRSAPRLVDTAQPVGTLILSGLQLHERDAVRGAFASAEVLREEEEEGWVALTLRAAGSVKKQ